LIAGVFHTFRLFEGEIGDVDPLQHFDCVFAQYSTVDWLNTLPVQKTSKNKKQ